MSTKYSPTPRRFSARRALAAALLSGFSAVAAAAPYSITYTGTIANSYFPQIINGESYTVTFVFDNGGSSANSQTWTGVQNEGTDDVPATWTGDLTCTIWRMNNARNVVYAQDLTVTPPQYGSGSVTTDASGALTSVFDNVVDRYIPSSAYTTSGFTLTSPMYWFANDANGVFYDDGTDSSFSDAAGGVVMDTAHWSAPQPFTGSCSASVTPPPSASVAAVPTLGEWSLALLGLAAAGLGARRLRRRG